MKEQKEEPMYKQKLYSKVAKVLDKSELKPGDVFIDTQGRRYVKTASGAFERVHQGVKQNEGR